MSNVNARLLLKSTWSHLSLRYHIREEETFNAIKCPSEGYIAILVVVINWLVVFVCSLACNSSVLPLWPATIFQSSRYTAKPILQISILKQRFFLWAYSRFSAVFSAVVFNMCSVFFRTCAKALMLAITDIQHLQKCSHSSRNSSKGSHNLQVSS